MAFPTWVTLVGLTASTRAPAPDARVMCRGSTRMRLPPRTGLPGALAVAVVIAVVASVPSTAIASGSGGTSAPAGGAGGGTAPVTPTTAPGTPTTTKGTKRRRSAPRPVLVLFHANARRFYDLGRPARVAFRIDGRGRTVRVKLQVLSAGRRVADIDLGDRATKLAHSVSLTGSEGGGLPEGTLQLRLAARDRRGRGLRPSGRASATDSIGFYRHRFPLTGPFDYGGPDARFGAGRPGHIHQGQDLIAPEGTPVVAPRGGQVTTV